MSATDIILQSFRKHRKIIYENDNRIKILTKGDNFYDENSKNLVEIAKDIRVVFYEMKIGVDGSFFWSGNIVDDIKWIFSIGGDGDGFFLTMNLQEIDENLLEGLRRIINFFNGSFKKEVVGKIHNNSF